MATLNHIVLGILILHINVYAAPNDVSKLEEIAKVEQAEPETTQVEPVVEQSDQKTEQSDPKLDSEPKEVESDSNSDETTRQKRWYNPYAYPYPPFNPFYNPGYDKRDEGANTGYYGENPLAQIHRRVQEIAQFVRQPQQQPLPPPHFPIFYPVLFIPPVDCNCNNENPNQSTTEPNNTPVTPPYDNGDRNNTDGTSTDGTTPNVGPRWPQLDDERQNWGIVVNENDSEEGVDFTRPISFDPIKLNRPGMRPPPPVEHGTVQSDSNNQNRPQSEAPSAQTPPARPPQREPQPPTTTRRPSQSFNRPQNSPPPRSPSALTPPSRCDGAILTCCHQPQVTYDCFAIQGCSDLQGYGSPCAPSQIVRVIDRFQMYYGQRHN
ncbi:hypothetical protein PYW08_001615 [Mythimna loreyi]|uniref:Uncharacterized protein n=1 Tax=Mythimna loreyi TaxID=667449 RepID=A0ACC2R6M2_9NEOP|nr:hypothetical protein PYW08_001615 [Mythimna loreyi]